MIDTKQYTSERSPDYLAATLREVAEMLTDVGKTIDARLAAWAVPETPEPEPPSVEVIDARSGATWLFSSIDLFERWDGRWRVWGHPRSPDGYGWDGCYIATAVTPFAIWQECVRKGVPCCDPPSVTLTLNIGDKWRVFAVNELRVAESGNTFIRCIGNRPDYGARYAVENTYYVTESPDAIRAACAREGVPCPEEEEPKTITVKDRVGDVWRFTSVNALAARMANGTPMLCIRGPQHTQDSTEWCETKTPLANIRKQAAEAGIDLPPVTVRAVREWTSIGRVEVKAASNDGLFCTVRGASDGRYVVQEFAPEVAEVLALCELAGWPKPQVRCVFTYANGDPCEVDPASVCSVDTIRLPGERSTLVTCEDGSTSCFVREPVAVVEAMRDACKPIEEVTQCHTESA